MQNFRTWTKFEKGLDNFHPTTTSFAVLWVLKMFSILNIDQVIRSLSGIGEVERRKGGIMQPRSSKLVGRYLRGLGGGFNGTPIPTPTWDSSDKWFKFKLKIYQICSSGFKHQKMSSCRAQRGQWTCKNLDEEIFHSNAISQTRVEVGYAVAYHGNSQSPQMWRCWWTFFQWENLCKYY